MPLRAVAEVNLGAIERNVRKLRARLAPGTRMCAVVKADAYGHRAVPSARAALRGGAGALAVASANEANELRVGGLSAPILVLGAVSGEELPVALSAGAELVAWDERFVEALQGSGAARPIRVHVKLDTGMGRLGTRDPQRALALARAVLAASPMLELAGVMTHFATADEDLGFVERQLRAFLPFVAGVRLAAPQPVIAHAANSAATMRLPASHLDMVRCGIAIYGADPMGADPLAAGLEPALSLYTYVAAVKATAAGESVGYGRRFVAERETHVATLPIGYADGISRRLSSNCDVLIGGRRYPLIGTISMDNVTVDLGPAPRAEVGQRATLIGTDGRERQTVEDLGRRSGTINYEILCAISRRVPRLHHRDGVPE